MPDNDDVLSRRDDILGEVDDFLQDARTVLNKALVKGIWPSAREIKWRLKKVLPLQKSLLSLEAHGVAKRVELLGNKANAHNDHAVEIRGGATYSDRWDGLVSATAMLLLNRPEFKKVDRAVKAATLRHCTEQMRNSFLAQLRDASEDPRELISSLGHYLFRDLKADEVSTKFYNDFIKDALNHAGYTKTQEVWTKPGRLVGQADPFEIKSIWGGETAYEAAQAGKEWLRDMLLGVADSFKKQRKGKMMAELERISAFSRLSRQDALAFMKSRFPRARLTQRSIDQMSAEIQAIKDEVLPPDQPLTD